MKYEEKVYEKIIAQHAVVTELTWSLGWYVLREICNILKPSHA